MIQEFDLLGYHITLEGLFPCKKAQKKVLENAKRRYAQGGEYLKHWRTWVHAGLPQMVFPVSKILTEIILYVKQPSTSTGRTKNVNLNHRGTPKWIKNSPTSSDCEFNRLG